MPHKPNVQLATIWNVQTGTIDLNPYPVALATILEKRKNTPCNWSRLRLYCRCNANAKENEMTMTCMALVVAVSLVVSVVNLIVAILRK